MSKSVSQGVRVSHSGQGNEPQPPAVRHAHEGVVLPANGEPWVPEQQAAPAAGQPWGEPWGPQTAQAQPPQHPAHPAPPYQPGHAQPYAAQPSEQLYGHAAPLPAEETQALPPQPAGDAEATQYIAPIPGGPLPPESPAEATAFLGANRPRAGGPLPAAAPLPPESGSAEDATQYIAPVPAEPGPGAVPPPPAGAPFGIRPGAPGDRRPPAEFDELFRAGDAPDSTQQLPAFHDASGPGPGPAPASAPAPAQPQPPQPAQGRAARRSAERGDRKKSLSPRALAGVVLGGCVVAGLAAGAALSGGGDEEEPGDEKIPVAASGQPTGEASPAGDPAKDPAEEQAKALDALLAESNDSRTAVIQAVKDIGSCTELSKAAQALRDAAEQRNSLVTRLGEISVDKLPSHQKLSESLTSAWKSSASADSHYAAWADQAAGQKGCKKGKGKGKAKSTGQTAAGNKASGEATAAKKEAAGLWNPIAKKYGLTERQYLEL